MVRTLQCSAPSQPPQTSRKSAGRGLSTARTRISLLSPPLSTMAAQSQTLLWPSLIWSSRTLESTDVPPPTRWDEGSVLTGPPCPFLEVSFSQWTLVIYRVIFYDFFLTFHQVNLDFFTYKTFHKVGQGIISIIFFLSFQCISYTCWKICKSVLVQEPFGILNVHSITNSCTEVIFIFFYIWRNKYM